MKMPEPFHLWRHEDACGDEVGPPTPMFMEAQMKQYGRDLLEAAAREASYYENHSITAKNIAAAIRSMKEKL